jgi:hypothetical protein
MHAVGKPRVIPRATEAGFPLPIHRTKITLRGNAVATCRGRIKAVSEPVEIAGKVITVCGKRREFKGDVLEFCQLCFSLAQRLFGLFQRPAPPSARRPVS